VSGEQFDAMHLTAGPNGCVHTRQKRQVCACRAEKARTRRPPSSLPERVAEEPRLTYNSKRIYYAYIALKIGHQRGLMFEPKTIKDQLIRLTEDDLDKRIYRVYKWVHVQKMFETGKNVLARPSKWDDPFENFLLQCTLEDSDGEPVSLEALERSWYGQCWTLTPESDAMWRIYSADKDGMRLSTTVRKLIESIFNTNGEFASLNCFIGRVDYRKAEWFENFLNEFDFYTFSLGGQTKQFADLLCLKRPEFEHEQEVRLLLRSDTNCNDLLFSEIKPNELFEDVLLDPRLKPHDAACQRKILQDLGCTLPVNQSTLYQFPYKKRVRL
jgi:hypothetical protein